MYQELLDSFVSFHSPKTAARKDGRLARHVDLFPTLCALVGVQCPNLCGQAGEFGGLNLFDLATNAAAPAVSEHPRLFQDRVAIKQDNFKLIVDTRTRRARFFDLESGPGERFPMASHPRKQALVDTLDRFIEGATSAPAEQASTSPQVKERLRALGYVK